MQRNMRGRLTYSRGIVCVGTFFVKSDLRLKPLSVERTFSWNLIEGEKHCLCRKLETQIKVKVIVYIEEFPTQTSSLHKQNLYILPAKT